MKYHRWFAGFTLTAFIFSLQTPIPLAQAAVLKTVASKAISSEKIITLSLPESLGKVQESYQGHSPETVVILQDAHSIPEAQMHLQGLIDFFKKKAGIDLVALEGAEGELDTQIFRSFPDQGLLKKVLKIYQGKGELSGGVAAALLNKSPAIYTGMDDWNLYEQGISYYHDAHKNLTDINSDLKALADKLTKDKESAYSEELLSVDYELERFYAKHSNFKDVLKVLAAVKRPESGGELALILEETERNEQDVKNFEASIQKSAEAVLNAIATSAQNAERVAFFNGKYQGFKTAVVSPEAFAAYLQLQAVDLNVSLSFSEELLLRIEHQKKLQAIEGTQFFKQFEIYAQTVKEILIQNTEQSLLDQATVRQRGLRKMAHLEMTFEDWQRFKIAEQDGEQTAWTESEKNILSGMRAQQDFYKTAEKRDVIFFKKISGLMRLHERRAVIAVAGGFHAEGLMRQCREKGISYVLVMPGLNHIPEKNLYREHMQGHVSWQRYFRVENGKINLYDAFVRSVRDQLIGESRQSSVTSLGENKKSRLTPQDPQLLKEWRDQLIRDLMAKGRVTDLMKYTHLLDEVTSEPEDAAWVQWKANIHRFVDGLRRLESLGTLNETEIQNLLKAATSIALADGPALLTHRAFRAEYLGAVRPFRPSSIRRRSNEPIFALRSEARDEALPGGVPSFQTGKNLSDGIKLRSEVRAVRRTWVQIGAAAVVGLALLLTVTLYRQAQPQEELPPPPVVLQLKSQPTEQLTIEDQGKATVLGLFRLIDARTGLVVDKARMDADNNILQERNHIDFTKTSPTNIGLELVSIVIARDHGWISKEDATAQIAKMVWTLGKMNRVRGFWYNWYDLANLDAQGVPKVALNQFISSVDNANLTAGLMVVQSALEGTPLAEKIQKLLEAQDWSFFYNSNIGLMGHGYDEGKKAYSNYGYGTFNTEARLLAFVSVLRGVDQKAWDGMGREVLADKNGKAVVASWGGSLFESLFADAFMGAPDPIAQNNRDTVQIHRDRAESLGYKFWGWSPAQNAKEPDLYEEAGIPEIGARDRGKGYPVGAVSPYSSLLAAKYVDLQVLQQNLANMRQRNPRVFSLKFGYRDAIDPRTGNVSSSVLSLDKGMEVMGFDLMLQTASNLPGTAEKYFWQYLKKENMDSRAKELFAAEKQKFAEARQRYVAGQPNLALKFEAVFSLTDRAGSGAWNNQSRVRRKLALDLERRTESIEEIDYDVTAAGAYGGTFYKQSPAVNPADSKATHVILFIRNVDARSGSKASFKLELKSGGQPVQELIITGVSDKWQELTFPLNAGIRAIDEVVTVFVHDPAGVNRGRLRIANIALAIEKRKIAEIKRSEVRRTAVPALTTDTRSVAALLYPGRNRSGVPSIDPRKARKIAAAYRKIGSAAGFEAAVIAQAEALPMWAFDEVMQSLAVTGEVTTGVAVGVFLPESLQGQAPAIFWKGFTAAFNKGEISELFKQGGRFDAQTESDLAARDIVPRSVKLSQSHELQSETDQAHVPAVIFDYQGIVNSMFFPLEIKDMKKMARSPRAAQFLGFLIGRVLKTQADLLRRQPKLSGQPEELKKELLAALWAQGFTGLEMGRGVLPNSLSLNSVSAMLVMRNLMNRRIETAA